MSRKNGWLARVTALFGHGVPEETWNEMDPGAGISESDRFLLDAFPFKWITTDGNRAMAEWLRLRCEGRFWPVIVGGDQELMQIAEQWGLGDHTAEQILAAAAELRHPETLRAYHEAQKERLAAFLQQQGEPPEEDYQPPVGDWPQDDEIEPVSGPSLVRDVLTGEPLGRVHILLMPTKAGHEVPALLRWGGWNECPPPEHHVAALRRWHEDYGAELVGLSGAVVELRLSKRLATKDEAMRLAREHYLYCNDAVDQGAGDLTTLAALLLVSDWWFFWWD
ncbi:MAG TPA: DUF4253 domain-containing protein [Allosphingosinicella sp.]|nr:DUF4253 domain-containing protein [Allosphingosinicella sp.]